jgi:hypothetical protein
VISRSSQLKERRFATAVLKAAIENRPSLFLARDFTSDFELLEKQGTHMRHILFSIIVSFVFMAAFTSCSTTVRSDSGHGVTAGVHDTGHGVAAGVHTQ